MAYWQCWLSGPESGERDSGVRGAGAVYGWRGPVGAAQCIECRCEARDLKGTGSGGNKLGQTGKLTLNSVLLCRWLDLKLDFRTLWSSRPPQDWSPSFRNRVLLEHFVESSLLPVVIRAQDFRHSSILWLLVGPRWRLPGELYIYEGRGK